jgi:methyl-accepting chemotaxis protein
MTEKLTNIGKQASAKGAGKNASRELFPEGASTDRFVRVFEASARRWELIIYPAMLAFGVLAAYGFFLIYSLSKDIHTLAIGMDPELGMHLSHISESVNYLSENMNTMTRRVYHMSESMETMADRIGAMEHLGPMLVNMDGINLSAESMNQEMLAISRSMDAMSYDMGGVSDSMRPMGRMNDLAP